MRLNKLFFVKNITFFTIILIACWQFGTGSYIYAKAQLAQYLLNSAWAKTLQGDNQVKPWDWADTYPVAKITFSKLKQHYIVLAGGNGRTMAFGPGHVSASPLPGNGGNSVIVGHRDTHFSVLKDLIRNDEIIVELPSKKVRYRVNYTFIVDQNQVEIMHDSGMEQLTLITCYPFDTPLTGGSLRYAVVANPI